MPRMFFIHAVFIVADFFHGTLGGNFQRESSPPSLVWWEKKPLIYSKNETAKDVHALDGLLPEIWSTVVSHCLDRLEQRYLMAKGFEKLELKKMIRPLPKITFPEETGPKDLIMPVKLRKFKDNVLGMPFIKLLDSPGVAVVIKKALTGTDLLNAILLAWPILIFVVLSALLSGFFIWFLEYRANPDMFDPFCPKGVLNGFWWASVTMTTVGYGDTIPKTILGRLFTIVWISAGLVILAMYMGVVTTSLATTRLEGTQHFYGITVAVVNQTEEHKFAILHNAHLQVEEDELRVIDAVEKRKNGVKIGFIDSFLASYYSDAIRKKKLHIVRVIPRNRAYGVLVGKDWAPDVDCLRRYSEDNRHVIQKLIPKYIRGSVYEDNLMEYFSGSVFGTSIYGLLGVLCFLIFLGWCYDRGYFTKNDKDSQNSNKS